ncbi:MAG TPA: hypothetical protein PK504_09640 [Ferruginibacter sp.]|nr:hypothetical protein [Ferruginibacter sp.]HRE63336.1 hypothetical protein [Ferruginibacter sp.]
MKNIFIPVLFCISTSLIAQQPADTVIAGKKIITLSNVVIDKNLDVPGFINKIKDDTSYYKAFKNLRILGFSAINDIRMNKRNGSLKASLFSKTKQHRKNNCRTMEVLQETNSGDFYTDDKEYNYYTAQMYASLFFTIDSVCGETNVVGNTAFSVSGKSGMEKHKEQLKMLFFNPGKKIKGLPFMSSKTEIFSDDMANNYDMDIDFEERNGINCYVFTQKVKPGFEDDVVLDEMVTWFHDKTFEVVARNYSLSYDAAVYDFKVQMQVEMTKFGELTVPSLIRYNGNWKAITKKRERGVFTATLFDFNNGN